MQQKDQKKSNQNNCWDCALHNKGGVNVFGKCMWWDTPKEIPENLVDKGCKFWRSEYAQKIIDRFNGELIIRRNYGRYNNTRRFRTKKGG